MIRVGNLVYEDDERVKRFVAGHIDHFVIDPKSRAIGVQIGDDLVAGVVYERFNGFHVEASIAANPRAPWATRQVLHGIFAYPFLTLGCQAVTVTIASTNLESLNLATKLGFEVEALVRFAASDGSTLIVLKMFANQCRWIRHDQEQHGRDASPAGSLRDSSHGSAV
jgi:hypothetical protein